MSSGVFSEFGILYRFLGVRFTLLGFPSPLPILLIDSGSAVIVESLPSEPAIGIGGVDGLSVIVSGTSIRPKVELQSQQKVANRK